MCLQRCSTSYFGETRITTSGTGKPFGNELQNYDIETLSVINFVRKDAVPGDVVLPGDNLLAPILALTKCRVPIGYFAYAAVARSDYMRRQAAEKKFWAAWHQGNIQEEFLREAGVRYIVVRKSSDRLPAEIPATISNVFENSEFAVFKVDPERLSETVPKSHSLEPRARRLREHSSFMAGIVIKPRARILHGHDWVFSSEVLKVFGNPADGDVISLKDGKDHLIGSAIYNSKSQIVARRFSRRRQDLDQDFFRRRIAQASEYRDRRNIDAKLRRVVWSESDGLPGVIIDRYGDDFVLQTLTLAMDMRKDLITAAMVDLFGDIAIVERNDAPIRKAEGLELRSGVLRGTPSQIMIEVEGVELEVDFLRGHKTGLYLDQKHNYGIVRVTLATGASWIALQIRAHLR